MKNETDWLQEWRREHGGWKICLENLGGEKPRTMKT